MRGLCVFFVLFSHFLFGQSSGVWENEKIEVKKGSHQDVILSAKKIYQEGWSDLAQPNFWKRVMVLSPNSCLVNIAETREVVAEMEVEDWEAQTEEQKKRYRDSIRILYALEEDARIYVTTGKSDFYQFKKVYPSISKGIEAFEDNGVDPWYAQSILLIESPGQLKKSKAGAYGAFQLMPSVARAQGLTVNRSIDEREDFYRCAYGSSELIKNVCIPEAKYILDSHGLSYEENELWFRLFVLHVYHAGAINVSAVVNKINPSEGGQSLIRKMWQNKAASFGNSSQNYSQLALASQLILDDIIRTESDLILECSALR